VLGKVNATLHSSTEKAYIKINCLGPTIRGRKMGEALTVTAASPHASIHIAVGRCFSRPRLSEHSARVLHSPPAHQGLRQHEAFALASHGVFLFFAKAN